VCHGHDDAVGDDCCHGHHLKAVGHDHAEYVCAPALLRGLVLHLCVWWHGRARAHAARRVSHSCASDGDWQQNVGLVVACTCALRRTVHAYVLLVLVLLVVVCWLCAR
jgi:hypothetical protein